MRIGIECTRDDDNFCSSVNPLLINSMRLNSDSLLLIFHNAAVERMFLMPPTPNDFVTCQALASSVLVAGYHSSSPLFLCGIDLWLFGVPRCALVANM